MQQQIPPSQQIQQLQQQLSLAYIQRDEAQVKVDETTKTITSIRNVLAGIGLGQQLQNEINAQKPGEQLAECSHT